MSMSRRTALTAALAAGLVAALPLPMAFAEQNFDNARIADAGVAENGTSRPTGWNQPGECIKSVQRWVAAAGGYFGGGGVISGYVNSGARAVSLANAVKGDVIQYTNGNGDDNDWTHVHTVVVIANHGNGRFRIVQSNAPYGSGKVTVVDNWAPSLHTGWVARVWRFGRVTSGGGDSSWRGVGSARFKGSNTLTPGQRLNPSEYILSTDGRFVLMMQADGNLVHRGPGGRVLWASNTDGKPGAYLGVQNDGNLVIYRNGQVLWASNTSSVKRLIAQTDGNLVAYNATSGGSAVWATGTVLGNALSYRQTDTLSAGARLNPGQYIRSVSKTVFAVMQADGNFVLYGPGYMPYWATGTDGLPGAYLGVQEDGNIVLYQGGRARWATNTTSARRLVIQSDWNLVARNSSGGAVWASGTDR